MKEDSELVRSAALIIHHPRYDSRSLENDIMLIKLATTRDYSADIQPTALPSSCAKGCPECLFQGEETHWAVAVSISAFCVYLVRLLLLYHRLHEFHVHFTPALQCFHVLPVSSPNCPASVPQSTMPFAFAHAGQGSRVTLLCWIALAYRSTGPSVHWQCWLPRWNLIFTAVPAANFPKVLRWLRAPVLSNQNCQELT